MDADGAGNASVHRWQGSLHDPFSAHKRHRHVRRDMGHQASHLRRGDIDVRLMQQGQHTHRVEQRCIVFGIDLAPLGETWSTPFKPMNPSKQLQPQIQPPQQKAPRSRPGSTASISRKCCQTAPSVVSSRPPSARRAQTCCHPRHPKTSGPTRQRQGPAKVQDARRVRGGAKTATNGHTKITGQLQQI